MNCNDQKNTRVVVKNQGAEAFEVDKSSLLLNITLQSLNNKTYNMLSNHWPVETPLPLSLPLQTKLWSCRQQLERKLIDSPSKSDCPWDQETM